MPQLLNINISDEASLFKACDYLHDATFSSDDVTETDQSELRIIFKREYFEDPALYKKEKTRFRYRESYPLARAELVLSNLKSLKRRGPDEYGAEVFNEVRRYKDGYDLESIMVHWTVVFDGAIQGSMRDLEILYDEVESGAGLTGWGCLLLLSPLIIIIALGWYFGWFG